MPSPTVASSDTKAKTASGVYAGTVTYSANAPSQAASMNPATFSHSVSRPPH